MGMGKRAGFEGAEYLIATDGRRERKEMGWVFWAMVGAAVIHVAEEYIFGWVDSARDFAGRSSRGFAGRFVSGIDLALFAVVNAFFILLCVVGALVGLENPVFSLSIACLFLFNAAMHLVPLIIVRRYISGAFSAVFLYIPLAFYAFHVADQGDKLNLWVALGAFLLGLLWQAIPLAAVFLRSSRNTG